MEVDDAVDQTTKDSIHDHCKLYVPSFRRSVRHARYINRYSDTRALAFTPRSSQFDPAPRDETWHKSPRTPDYFL